MNLLNNLLNYLIIIHKFVMNLENVKIHHCFKKESVMEFLNSHSYM